MYAGVLRGTVVLLQDSETNSRDLKDFNLQVVTLYKAQLNYREISC